MIGEFNTREALETAIEVLRARAAETDTASPEGHAVRCAIETIDMLLAQRGCEHFDSGLENGNLTTLCDLIVFG